MGCALAVACETAVPQRAAPPLELFVAAPGAPRSELADGSDARPFATVADALRAAPDGALLRLAAAEYRERIEVRRPVVLLGRGPSRTRLVAPEPWETVLTATAPVELHGVSIEGGATGVVLEGQGHRLVNVSLRGQHEAGVRVTSGSLALWGCEILDVEGGRTGYGVLAAESSIDARQLLLRAAGRRGVSLHGGSGVFEQLDAEGSSAGALQVVDAVVDVQAPRFAALPGHAIFAGASTLRVRGGTFTGGEYGIITSRGSRVDIEGGAFQHQGITALALVGSSGTVRGVRVQDAGTDGGIAVVKSKGKVLVERSELLRPGVTGLHLTMADVEVRDVRIEGARHDRDGDFGNGIFALDSKLRLEHVALRHNAGAALAATQESELRVDALEAEGNQGPGVFLSGDSTARVQGSRFADNRGGVVAADGSSATVGESTFADEAGAALDAGCGAGHITQLLSRNVFHGPVRRVCP